MPSADARRLQRVAIVGRPNVGKSSLFNWLAGRRISIVDPTAGVTRDRISTIIETGQRSFELLDTGGMGIVDVDDLSEDVERQIRHAINSAAVVLFVVDVKEGIAPLDEMVADRLRVVAKPVIFVANKADDPKHELESPELFRLGYGKPLCVSAEQKRGRDELLEAILEKLPPDTGEAAPKMADLKIALVGRRNVGKSTFINSLADADRVIVSEIAGTTRDSVDVRFERDGKAFIAIDTAGVRKRKSLANDIEFYGMHRAERSIRRADVVLHLFDPLMSISRVDKKLAEYIVEHNKPAIFVVNKWDLAKDKIPTEKWGKYLRKVFPMLDHVPIAFTTATEGKNIFRLLNLCQVLHKQAGKRMRTGDLNRVIRDAMAASSPPMRNNRMAKVYYVAQVESHPPTIVMVTNGPEQFDDTYVRYLTKAIRDASPFAEVAIKLVIRAKADAAGRGKIATPEEATQELPALSMETPADPLEAVRVDEVVAPPKQAEAAPKPRRKKRPDSGTWKL